MSHADALIAMLEPVLPGFEVQFPKWVDRGSVAEPAEEGQPGEPLRYAVLRPAGGLPAELVRRPEFTLFFCGSQGDTVAVSDAINAVIERCRQPVDGERREVFYVKAGEPAFVPTADGRTAFEIALSVIAN